MSLLSTGSCQPTDARRLLKKRAPVLRRQTETHLISSGRRSVCLRDLPAASKRRVIQVGLLRHADRSAINRLYDRGEIEKKSLVRNTPCGRSEARE